MSSQPLPAAANAVILDLDRDLLRSNIALETAISALKTRPFAAMGAIARLLATSVEAARPAFEDLPFDAATGLYDSDLVEALKAAQEQGQTVFVTSVLPAPWVEAIRSHLGIDWRVADPEIDEIDIAASILPADRANPSPARAILKLLRLHQWSKNILIFVPLALTHRFFDADAIMRSFIAFLCFGLVASSIYVLNDMMDIQQDRKHASKRRRPFASGALQIRTGFLLVPLLAGGGFWLGSVLPKPFLLILSAYVLMNLAYVFFLKRKLLVDVLTLAGGYTLRLLAGNAAGPVELSSWLLAFSMFLFVSLALVKRYVEIDTTEVDAAASHKVMGRGYRRSDLDMLSQLGVSSGFSAVVVMALYVDAAGRQGLYRIPELIWLVCPIVLFVIARIWVLAKRREMPDDPVMFIIRDWRSHLMAVFIAAILVIAK